MSRISQRNLNLKISKGKRYKQLEKVARLQGLSVSELHSKSPDLYDKIMNTNEIISINSVSKSPTLQATLRENVKQGIKQYAVIECRSMQETCALLHISQPLFYRVFKEIQEEMRLSAKSLKLSGDSLTVEFAERYKDRVAKLNKKTNTNNEIADVLAMKELRENDKDFQGFLMKSGILKNSEPTSLDTLLSLFGVEKAKTQIDRDGDPADLEK